MYESLVYELKELDEQISDVIVASSKGDIISSTIKDIERLEDAGMEQALFEMSLILDMLKGREKHFGVLHNLHVTFEKNKLLVFPLPDDNMLFISYQGHGFDSQFVNTIRSRCQGKEEQQSVNST